MLLTARGAFAAESTKTLSGGWQGWDEMKWHRSLTLPVISCYLQALQPSCC
jgi:hypothetical protein